MEKPMRILHVLGRLDRGGAETMVMNLYRHMDRDRIQFDFVIHTEDRCDYSEEVEALGGKIYAMKPYRCSTALSYRSAWRKFFREHKEYRIVHGHMRSTASIYLQEAKRAGMVAIAHSHNTSSGKGISALVKNILQYPIRYRADYLFSCSKRAGVWLYGKQACESDRFVLLKNGITTDIFNPQKSIKKEVYEELYLPENGKMLLHVGRLETQKNHKYLFEIVDFMQRNSENKVKFNLNLMLCGVGPLEKPLRKMVREYGLDSCIHFLGIREDIPRLMQAADLMIFPSLFEGLPVTLVEAQAAGLPVLMSDSITDEVVLTDLIQTASLKESPKLWADKAMKMLNDYKNNDRNVYAKQIEECGYDVRQNAKWLADFYWSLGNTAIEVKD